MLIPVHRVPSPANAPDRRGRAIVVGHAVVDEDMAHLVAEFWTLTPNGYAVASRKGRLVRMHHAVAGRVPGLDVSHENANKLDNRRHNLRHVTRGENMRNPADGPTRALTTNRFRGVTRDNPSRPLPRPWRGKVQIDGKTFHTARCATAGEAAMALDDLRARLCARTVTS